MLVGVFESYNSKTQWDLSGSNMFIHKSQFEGQLWCILITNCEDSLYK